jgi:hypothetical protein
VLIFQSHGSESQDRFACFFIVCICLYEYAPSEKKNFCAKSIRKAMFKGSAESRAQLLCKKYETLIIFMHCACIQNNSIRTPAFQSSLNAQRKAIENKKATKSSKPQISYIKNWALSIS